MSAAGLTITAGPARQSFIDGQHTLCGGGRQRQPVRSTYVCDTVSASAVSVLHFFIFIMCRPVYMLLNSAHSLRDLTNLTLMHYFLNLPAFGLIIRLSCTMISCQPV